MAQHHGVHVLVPLKAVDVHALGGKRYPVHIDGEIHHRYGLYIGDREHQILRIGVEAVVQTDIIFLHQLRLVGHIVHAERHLPAHILKGHVHAGGRSHLCQLGLAGLMIHPHKVCADHVRIGLFQHVQKLHHAEILSGGMGNAAVDRGAGAGVLLGDQPDGTGILCLVLRNDLCGIVLGAIVCHQNLHPIRYRRIQKGIQTLLNKLLDIIGRNRNTQYSLHENSSPSVMLLFSIWKPSS